MTNSKQNVMALINVFSTPFICTFIIFGELYERNYIGINETFYNDEDMWRRRSLMRCNRVTQPGARCCFFEQET
jgi:hypothetical protein